MSDFDAHLLVVDDDERIRTLLQKFLIRNGFLVTAARDAQHARRILTGLDFDMIILDVMMPGEDGLSLCRSLRETKTTPILLLTARGETDARIEGFEAGADDYLPKPFEPKELLLRINAVLRRMPDTPAQDSMPKILHLGDIRYDIERGEMWQGQDIVRLTGTEMLLMKIFPPSPATRSAAPSWSRNWAATGGRPRNARSTCKSPVCAARSKAIRNSRAICKPCAARAICWLRTDGNFLHKNCGPGVWHRVAKAAMLTLAQP